MLRIVPRSLFVKLGWTTFSYGAVQASRLLNNVILARLLAPPLFGLMLIVNTIVTGVQLLSDVGISQAIVRHGRGGEPRFYDTAWTVQVLRGLVLGAACFLFSQVAARLLGTPQLGKVLPVAALFFLFSGLNSTSSTLLHKRIEITRLSQFDIIIAGASLIIHVGLAILTPTIWALILGSIITGAVTLTGTFLLIPGLRHELAVDRQSLRELLGFGKWIFFSSMIYFGAMNFDRLYFAKNIPLAQLGTFGIARSLSDAINAFVQKCGSLLLFPMVAAMTGSVEEIRGRLRHGRRVVLVGGALVLGLFTTLSDTIVHVLFDIRYHQAGVILPVLALGLWFALLSGINDSILIGLGHPKLSAAGNAAKFLTFVIGVPVALIARGFDAAVVVLSAGELVRYLTLWLMSRRHGIGFARDDFAATALFAGAVVAFRLLFDAIGLTGGLGDLFPYLFALLP